MGIIFALFLAISSYVSPVNYPITLAGNFGEPRVNHFHAGIDIKTMLAVNKPVFAVNDGFVSRVIIGLNGYGKAICVQHPDGYTTLYAHLNSFPPYIQSKIRKKQYEKQSDIIDIHFAPTDIPVQKGQLIALSGNTGSSQAPHIHLEVIKTRSGEIVDPLSILGHYIKDNTKPEIAAFRAYPQDGAGVFCKSSENQTFTPSQSIADSNSKLTAWGLVGFAIKANDYMENSRGNKYGIRKMQLFADEKEVFSSDFSGIFPNNHLLVNYWADVDYYFRTHLWFMKSFTNSVHQLPFMHTNSNYGLINFNKERTYKITYCVTDFYGNTSNFTFYVKGERQNFKEKRRINIFNTLCYNRVNTFLYPGISLTIPAYSTLENTELLPKITTQDNELSHKYILSKTQKPLFNLAKLTIKLNKTPQNPTKLYVVEHRKYDRFLKCYYKNGYVSTFIKYLNSEYEVKQDLISPIISPINKDKWSATKKIKLFVSDTQSGLKWVKAYVDNTYILLERQDNTTLFTCNLRKTALLSSKKTKEIIVKAMDNCGNLSTLTTHIIY